MMTMMGTTSSSSMTRFAFWASLVMLVLNITILNKATSRTTSTITTSDTSNTSPSTFWNSQIGFGYDVFSNWQAVEETVSIHDRSKRLSTDSGLTQSSPTNSNVHAQPERKHPRTLMGIFSSDSYNDATYRGRHRKLMNEIWKDSRVCAVHQFVHNSTVRSQCQLLYTFVIGANPNPDAPMELLEDTPSHPLTLPKMDAPTRDDVNREDVTLLNIRSVIVSVGTILGCC
jgi:hypothetical protein